ncbi:MAG: hypothetical protein ACPIOQ_67210, partial [Promethearchaeia archaeon]
WLEPYAGFKVQMMKEREFNNKWWDCTTWSKRASEISSIVNSGSPPPLGLGSLAAANKLHPAQIF